MIADSERREVARKLREVNPYRNQSHTIPCNRYIPAVEYLSELAGALGYSPKNDVSRIGFQNRLADLIEPEAERTCSLEYDTVHHDYVCTKCGERYDSGMYTSVSDDDKFLLKPMKFCTNCGAKVVDA